MANLFWAFINLRLLLYSWLNSASFQRTVTAEVSAQFPDRGVRLESTGFGLLMFDVLASVERDMAEKDIFIFPLVHNHSLVYHFVILSLQIAHKSLKIRVTGVLGSIIHITFLALIVNSGYDPLHVHSVQLCRGML